MPEDAVSVVLHHLPPSTARLVNRRTRQQVDAAKTALCVYGLGRDGRPAVVAARFPNLTDLTVTVKNYHLMEAYHRDPAAAPPELELTITIPWEEYAANVHEGLAAWAAAVASLRHLRHLHLDIGTPLAVLTVAQEIALLRTFVPEGREGTLTFGSWSHIRREPALYRKPNAHFRAILDRAEELGPGIRPSDYLSVIEYGSAPSDFLSRPGHSTA